MAACRKCGGENGAGAALCAFCGATVDAGGAARPAQQRGKLALLLGLVLVAIVLWRVSPFRHLALEDDCRGGASAEVIWKTSDPRAPRIELPNVNQIDPAVTPFIELARLRSTGTRRYGENNDRQFGHLHQGVVDGLHAAGANAYFHHPSRTVGQDLAETETSAVLAHPGPVRRALRDQYIPSNRAAMITKLQAGGIAEQAGLRVNDVVVAVNGQPVGGSVPSETLLTLTTATPAGGVAVLQVLRDNEVKSISMPRQGKGKFGYWSTTVPLVELVD
jgi:membrane-associated protease RseP (regulator of RpoE activity)